MAMTTEEAMAFVEKLHAEPSEQTIEQAETQNEKQEVSPESNTDCSTEVKQDAETETSKEIKNDNLAKTNAEAKANAETKAKAKTYAEMKSAYAFAREKSKRKELKKHYEQQIADLKKQLNDRLSAKPAADDVSELVDYKLESARLKDSISSMENDMRNLDVDDIQYENERRIANAWTNEADRAQYRNLLESNGRMFLDALKKYDPDNVVLEYLDGQQDYPILLKELMTNADSLKSVFIHNDTMGRLMALDVLNRKLHSVKPNIAKIGRLVRNSANVTSTKKDNNYWNNWLKNHPRH